MNLKLLSGKLAKVTLTVFGLLYPRWLLYRVDKESYGVSSLVRYTPDVIGAFEHDTGLHKLYELT